MSVREGDIVLITLNCGCEERRITVMPGKQSVHCPTCGRETVVVIETDRRGEVLNFKVRHSYA